MNKKDMFIKEKLQQDKVISDRANKIFDNIKEEFKVERKVIKISLGTFIAIAASLVIVGFIGINIYANSLGKPNIISGIKALLKEEPEVNTDEIAEELFKKAMLAIRDPYKYYEDTDSEAEEIEDKYYKKTNSTYDEVKLKYSEIFTEEALENVLALKFYNKKGILYAIAQAGGTPWQIVELKVEKINQEKEELTYNAIYKLSYTDDPAGKEPKEQKCQFKIKKVDGEYRISATNYCNLDGIKENQNNTENNYEKEFIEFSQTEYEIVKVYNDGRVTFSVTDLWKEYFNNGILEANEEYIITGLPDVNNYDIKILKYTEQTYIAPYVFITCISEDYRQCSTYSVNTVEGFKTGKFEAKHLIDGDYAINNTLIGSLEEEVSGGYYYYGPEFASTTSSMIYHVDRDINGEITLREYKKQNNQLSSDTSISYGDVDLDGQVTDWDEIYLTRYLNNWDGYGLSENAKLNADVNDDGIITQGDANILKKYLVGEITKLPYRISGTELISKKLQGITINYPSDWSSYEFSRDMGENIVAFAGRVNNVDISVNVYNPFYLEGDYKSLIKNECSKYGIEYRDHFVGIGFNIGSTDSKYLEWQELPVREDMISYYHIVNEKNIAYKIEVCIFNYEKDTNLVPAYRVIDDIITGASISLNY